MQTKTISRFDLLTEYQQIFEKQCPGSSTNQIRTFLYSLTLQDEETFRCLPIPSLEIKLFVEVFFYATYLILHRELKFFKKHRKEYDQLSVMFSSFLRFLMINGLYNVRDRYLNPKSMCL